MNLNIKYSDLLYLVSFYLIVIDKMAKKEFPIVSLQGKYVIVYSILFFTGIGTFLSLFRTNDMFTSVGGFIQYVFIFIFLLTIIDYLIDKQLTNAIKILGIYLIPSAVSSIIVVLSNFGIVNKFDRDIIYGLGRYQGFDGTLPTAFGENTTLAFIIFFMFWRICNRKLHKIIFLTLSIMNVYVVLLTGSFGAMFMTFSAIILILFFGSKKKALMKTLTVILIVIAATLFFLEESGNYSFVKFLPSIIQTRLDFSNGDLGSYDVRSELNTRGIEEFVKSPIVGVGYLQFVHYNTYYRVVHNTMISAAVESGIFGLIGVMFYLLSPIYFSTKLIKRKIWGVRDSAVIHYLMIYACIRLVQTLTSHEYIYREQWIPCLIIFVLYVNYNKEVDKDNKMLLG